MGKTGFGLLVVLVASACNPQTGTVEPIVIDLSHREPSATTTPIPTPAPTQTPAPVVPAAPVPAPAVSAAGAEQVVDRQLDAFNRHDLEAFLATYAPSAILYDHPDKVRQAGAAEIRKTYGVLFGETRRSRSRSRPGSFRDRSSWTTKP